MPHGPLDPDALRERRDREFAKRDSMSHHPTAATRRRTSTGRATLTLVASNDAVDGESHRSRAALTLVPQPRRERTLP